MIQLCLRHSVTHDEPSFRVRSRVCLEHLWLTVWGLEEQREVGKAKRKTTSENEDNNCFCAKSESHAQLNKSCHCHRGAKPQQKREGPIQATSITVSVLYTCLEYSWYMVELSKPETCCHLLRLWASCLKCRASVPLFTQMICRKSIM